MTRWSAHRRGRHGLARTFQHSHAFRGLSVRENVEVSALGVGASAARRSAAGRRAARAARPRRATRTVPRRTLSHGDERRLGVARALATEPRYVLMDEPAAGLPEAEVPRFAAAVNTVRDRGAGVLLVDHNVALVLDVCERIQVLDQGPRSRRGRPPRSARISASPPRTSARARRPRKSSDRPRGREPLGPLRRGRGGARSLARGEAGPDRRPDRPERRREVVDAPRDHGLGSDQPAATCGSTAARSSGRRPEDVARRGIALVPEGRRIFGELTVEENLRLGLAARRKQPRRRRHRARLRALSDAARVPRAPRRARSRAASSSSSRSARALAADPDVLLLDEPSLGLAPKIVDVVFEALTQIRDAGLAVLLVEQRAQRTVALADESYVLANGELRLTLGPQDAGDTDRLVAAYLA